jgi:hypothetical protein
VNVKKKPRASGATKEEEERETGMETKAMRKTTEKEDN